MTVIEIILLDDDNNRVFKQSLWLAIVGKERDALALDKVYSHYASRYHIEHFFRFGKTKLLLTAYQTPEVTHEENWWRFQVLAYNQLYLSSTLVPRLPKPWEKYLPEYRDSDQDHTRRNRIATPSQTQRGFHHVLASLPALATPPTPRGKPTGRQTGDRGSQRLLQGVIFKKQQQQKTPEIASETIIPGSEKADNFPDPLTIQTLVRWVTTKLAKLHCSTEKFNRLLLDSS